MPFFSEHRLIYRSSAGSRAGSRRAGYAASSGSGDTKESELLARQEAARLEAEKRAREEREAETKAFNEARASDNERQNTSRSAREATIASGGTHTSVVNLDTKAPAYSALSREQQQQFAQANAMLEAKFISDPQYAEGYSKVTDYLKQIQQASPEEREQLFTQLKQQANSLVDESFDKQVKTMRDRLTMKIRQMNDQFSTLTKSEQYKLEQAVQSLDSDAVKNLESDLSNLFSRGGINSGLFRRIADRIIETRELGAKDAKTVRDLNLESGKQRVDQNIETLNDAAAEDFGKIEDARTAERSSMLSDLINDYTQQGLLADLMTGAGNLKTPQGAPSSTLASIRSQLPSSSVAAPAGSSLDIARKVQSGEMTAAQGQVAREKLLSGSSTPTTASTVRSTPITSTSSTVTNPNTNKTYTGGAADRLAARLAR